MIFSDSLFIDNHDIISLKLYQLTVLRSKKEDEEEDEVTIPSVDNMELIRSKRRAHTHTHMLMLFNNLHCHPSIHPLLSLFLFSSSGSEWRGDEWNSHFLHRSLLHAGLYLPHRHRPGGLQPLEWEPTQALLLRTKTRRNVIVLLTVAHESETLQMSACRAQRFYHEDDTITTGDLSPTTKSHSPTLPLIGMKQYDNLMTLFYTSAPAWHTHQLGLTISTSVRAVQLCMMTSYEQLRAVLVFTFHCICQPWKLV